MTTNFRYEATSLTGLIQYLAANVLPHGYWFYIQGHVPDGKDPCAVDAKLIGKYGIAISRQERARRKRQGLANLHYLRWGLSFWLLATHGAHRFFAEESLRIRDVRRIPIQIGGYSLAVKMGGFLKRHAGEAQATKDHRHRVRVQIARRDYARWKAHFLELARHRSAGQLAEELSQLPFEPYAPIRKQLLNLVRLINQMRSATGFQQVSPDVLRYQRRIVRPFQRMDDTPGMSYDEWPSPGATCRDRDNGSADSVVRRALSDVLDPSVGRDMAGAGIQLAQLQPR